MYLFSSATSWRIFCVICLICVICVRFLLAILFNKSLLISLFTCGFHMPFSVRTPLNHLRPVIHPKVISILPQQSSQAIYRYYQIRFHVISFRFAFDDAIITRPSRTSSYGAYIKHRTSLKIRHKDNTKTYFSVPRKVEILSKNRIFFVFALLDRNKVVCYESVVVSVDA